MVITVTLNARDRDEICRHMDMLKYELLREVDLAKPDVVHSVKYDFPNLRQINILK